jgi:murein DD-endopeptidase MepM/ murein hydrolase activator NlpD
VFAAGDGTVSFVGPAEGFGKLVVVQHSSGVETFYGHLSKFLVTVGKRVSRGMPLGLVGMTGDATGPHLHFEIWIGGWRRDKSSRPVDPLAQLQAWDH